MKFFHATTGRLLIGSLFALTASLSAAQAPPMTGVSGDSTPSASTSFLRIVEPADGAMIHDNSGDMIVRVAEASSLATGKIELLIDGRPVAARKDGDTFLVSGVDRGTHSLQARSIGRNGEIVQSDPVTFSLWQASKLFRQPK